MAILMQVRSLQRQYQQLLQAGHACGVGERRPPLALLVECRARPTLRTALASSCVSEVRQMRPEVSWVCCLQLQCEARLLHVRTGLVDLEDLLEARAAALIVVAQER